MQPKLSLLFIPFTLAACTFIESPRRLDVDKAWDPIPEGRASSTPVEDESPNKDDCDKSSDTNPCFRTDSNSISETGDVQVILFPEQDSFENKDIPANSESSTKPKPPTGNTGNIESTFSYSPVPAAWRNKWPSEWSQHVGNAVEFDAPNLLNTSFVPLEDIQRLCPAFGTASKQEKKAFWALFFASIARFESGYDPKAKYKESWGVYSLGLLQLSYGDEKGHRKCKLNPTLGNALDPQTNLHCGVMIMENQFRAKKGLFPTKPYYWSVLTNKINQNKVKQFFLGEAHNIPACKK